MNEMTLFMHKIIHLFPSPTDGKFSMQRRKIIHIIRLFIHSILEARYGRIKKNAVGGIDMKNYETMKTRGDTEWFEHDRFGMFIHFGLYALPARHEWVKARECIKEEKYQKYFENFDPDLCDPREWARSARAAGMKYALLTTKHHEGFCLFDSQYTDYKITNTKYKKDLVREYADAFRAEGLRVGFYYSLIDWHHPDFPIDVMHPRREDADAEEQDCGRDMKKYAEYVRNQVRELLTNYGKIDIMWFDFSYEGGKPAKPWMQFGGGKGKDEWESEKLTELVRSLCPNIIMNNRAGIDADIWTPEQYQPTRWITHPKTKELVTWEACHTMSGSWGYYRDEMTWKSPEMFINLLTDTVALGGNLIMNVGPTARGYLDRRAEDALGVYRDWMKYNSRSIYGCTMADPKYKAPDGTKLTQSKESKRLYIHLQKYPFAYLKMENIADDIEYAQFLHDGSEIQYVMYKVREEDLPEKEMIDTADIGNGSVCFKIPPAKPDTVVPVIEVILK